MVNNSMMSTKEQMYVTSYLPELIIGNPFKGIENKVLIIKKPL
jgi:hypothetical protein